MINKKFTSILAASLLLAGSASAAAPGSFSNNNSFTLNLRGFVPVICRASVDGGAAFLEDGVANLGTLKEFCNSGQGYDVWLDHASGVEGVSVMVDGERIALSPGGSTRISGERSAAVRSHQLAIDMGDEGAQLSTLSLRVVAL